MRWLDRIRTETLAVLAIISVFTALCWLLPYLPHATLHAQQAGPGGVPGSSGSGGGVSSVFGRTGTVVSASGDYTAAQVTGAATSGANSNITSLTGLTTPLSVAQGGIGATSLSAAAIAVTNTANTFAANQTMAATYSLTYAGATQSFVTANLVSGFGSTNYWGVSYGSTGIFSIWPIGYGADFTSGPMVNSSSCYQWSSSATAPANMNAAWCSPGGGIIQGDSAPGGGGGAYLEVAAMQSTGTVMTVSGCGTATATGGASIATFSAGSATCNPVITPGKTATHGWHCTLDDETTAATWRQTAHTTTTATIAGSGVLSGDTIDVSCGAF